jgi:hypothetical protein
MNKKHLTGRAMTSIAPTKNQIEPVGANLVFALPTALVQA